MLRRELRPASRGGALTGVTCQSVRPVRAIDAGAELADPLGAAGGEGVLGFIWRGSRQDTQVPQDSYRRQIRSCAYSIFQARRAGDR